MPVKDTHQVGIGITNPYGRTKFILEEMLKDLAVSDEKWKITMLRYKTFKNYSTVYITYDIQFQDILILSEHMKVV